jgi:hypothetical protein
VDPDRTNDQTARSAARRTRTREPPAVGPDALLLCRHSFPFTPLAPLLRFEIRCLASLRFLQLHTAMSSAFSDPKKKHLL